MASATRLAKSRSLRVMLPQTLAMVWVGLLLAASADGKGGTPWAANGY